jgi:hypothetical protein
MAKKKDIKDTTARFVVRLKRMKSLVEKDIEITYVKRVRACQWRKEMNL